MNVLFVNYADFTTNSLNHIAGFAEALTAAGHSCVVAINGDKATLSAIPNPRFAAATYEELLETPAFFPDGRPADVIHAWTPREGVRRFVVAYKRLAPSRLIVHLEDNEEFLLSSYMGRSFDELKNEVEFEYPRPLTSALPHPTRYKTLLRLADGVTVIVDSLKAFVPSGIPVATLPPGVDFTQYHPQAPDPQLKAELRLRSGEKVIVFTGSNTFANESEVRDLYLAVKLLNTRGVPTRLVRTGFTAPAFGNSLPADWKEWTLDLGFLEKKKLPRLLALADVLVQPGRPGAFNDYRLPSKLPEFFASGRPVVLPASNIGLELTSGQEAIVLSAATPETIADACADLFAHPERADAIARAGAALARERFDLKKNSERLAQFYVETCNRSANTAWQDFSDAGDVTLLARTLRSRLQDLPVAASAAWKQVIEIADELARLCRELEASAEAAETILASTRTHLEHERDDWKNAWNLTNQHLKNVEDGWQATRNHAGNLERTLAATQTQFENSEAVRKDFETLLKSARQQIAAFEAELVRSERTRKQVESELAQTNYQLAETRARALTLGESSNRLSEVFRETIRERDDALFQRDEKIRAMQRSFSWQVTAPFRALRRALIDPYRKKKNVPPQPKLEYDFSVVQETAPKFSPADFIAPIRSFRYSVDYPHRWSFGVNKVVIRGWCLTVEDVQLKEIRARVSGRTYPGVYGLKRMDVLAALRDVQQAEYCGYKIEVALEETDKEIELSVGDTRGVWHVFFKTPIRVGVQYGEPELTSYERWAATYDTHTSQSRELLTANISRFERRPLISVVMPVYHRNAGEEKWLVKAIESVRAQAYPYWELCIADDASPAPHVRPLLESYAKKYPRIKVVFREKNGHISAASNSALELASGEFVALLDHDDEIAPHALYEVAALLNTRPNTDYVYSDEDKIDEEGSRHEPYFKPDFLPDLFTSQNYTSHLSVYRAELLTKVGGFRVGYEGSQDWDLALRVISESAPERIQHIPKVLYHWRAIPGSTALLISEKNYPVEAARRALTDHFQRMGQRVELAPVPGDHWRIKRPRPTPAPLVSLVMPTRNGLKVLSRCVDTILEKTTYPNFEILIVDNGSNDPKALEWLGRFTQVNPNGAAVTERATKVAASTDRVRVLRYDAPFNYSAINNFGVKHARGEIVGLLNNDLEAIHADWLDEMVSQALRPEIGCVGAMLYYPNDTIQHAGVIVGLGGVAGHAFRDFPRGTDGKFNRARLVQNYSSVTAACLLIRKAVYEEVGGFDEQLAVAFNDIDFCLKVRAAGYRNLWTPFAELYHHESATRGAEDTPEKHERFRQEVELMLARWKDAIAHDPAYNPNLSLELTDFSLAAPPRTWNP